MFFHAHPDDEAIFTGGSIARLTSSGVRVVVVIATAGELGEGSTDRASLARLRRVETREACEALGVSRVVHLDYSDSGLAPPGGPLPDTAFALADVNDAARRLASVIDDENADTLVYYDEGGIYGHADHLAVHRVGRRAAELASVKCVYEATVDREHLHFVETHLVGHAVGALHEPVPAGVPSVLVTTTIDVTDVIGAKRRAMAAHASQIRQDSDVMHLDDATFTAVYGHEWYIRAGARGLLDEIAR